MAAVTPVASVEALVGVIEKSGLLSAEALTKVREAAAKCVEPKALARDLVKGGTLTRWQAEQLINGYHRLLVGKYKLLDQIATSPTGRVYLAEHVQMGRRHSLKVLARRLASNPEAVKHFLDSARNACSLDHRNISHVYDVNHDRIGHYVVMDHVEGEDLEQLVERTGRVELLQALDFIRQAAEGLAHAHENGVVHGDLKPANLLRDHSGTIKILEIGQAGVGAKPETEEDADESVETASLAAVIFQAPELRGDGEGADVACDIYSLGSVLCFLLTAKAAKDAAAAVKLLEEIPDLSAGAISFCARLMADKPTERPHSAQEVLSAITDVARQISSTAKQSFAEKSEQKPAAEKPKTETLSAKPAAAEEKPQPPTNGEVKAKQQPADKLTDKISDVPPVIVTADGIAAAQEEEAPAFVIKTRGRGGKKARKPASAAAGAPVVVATAPKDAAVVERTDGDKKSLSFKVPWNANQAPLVLAGAIGLGGMLVLALGVGVIGVMMSRGGRAPANQVAATTAAGAAQQPTMPAAVEPEAQPSPVVAGSPEVAAAPTSTGEAAAVATAATTAPAADPKPSDPFALAATAPSAKPTATEIVAAAPAPVPAEPKVEPKTEPKTEAKTEPAPEKKVEVAVAPKSESKPAASVSAKPAAPASPFAGFAKAVALPPLPDSPDSAASALEAKSLGPCKADEKATLAIGMIGGETAIRNPKQKFELQPSPDSKRDWNFVLSGGPSPATVATLSAAGGELRFQWTEEAVKQPAVARQLCNCVLTLGSSKQIAALRTPELGAPLTIDLDKPNVNVKWNIGELPVAKQIFVEVTKAEMFKVLRKEPKTPVPVGESIQIGTGPSDKSVPLVFKLNTSSTANAVNVVVQPNARFDVAPELKPFRRKELVTLQEQKGIELSLKMEELAAIKKSNPTRDPEKKVKEFTITRLSNELVALNNMLDQLRYVIDFSGSTEGQAKLHFRVYFLAGTDKIDLLKTEEDPPGKN